LVAAVCSAGLLLTTCESGEDLAGGASETGNTDVGMLRIETFDSPPPEGIEHLYLEVKSLEAHHEGEGWLTASTRNNRIDFLALLNGRTAVICDTSLPVGRYDQLRLLLGEENEIVVNGETFALDTPSATTSGIKIHVFFKLEPNDSTRVYLDFDASKSVKEQANRYKLAPSFTAYDASKSGRISGRVNYSLAASAPRALVTAAEPDDTLATLTDEDGNYALFLPAGTYEISCQPGELTHVDTTYRNVIVAEGAEVAGLDFRAW